jgi:hypothetical protein
LQQLDEFSLLPSLLGFIVAENPDRREKYLAEELTRILKQSMLGEHTPRTVKPFSDGTTLSF